MGRHSAGCISRLNIAFACSIPARPQYGKCGIIGGVRVIVGGVGVITYVGPGQAPWASTHVRSSLITASSQKLLSLLSLTLVFPESESNPKVS